MGDLVDEFVRGIDALSPQSPERLGELRTLCGHIVELARSHRDVDELGIAADALNELAAAARVFSPWRERPKLTVFGSARIKPDDPLYQMASELSRRLAAIGWMTVSGAGPGIMEAAARGAGIESTLGVNVDLPFEQSPNPYVDADTRLVEMKYFFTRKVALVKESLAFAFFPGGLGTMDELFEILTLLHTGKSSPAPVLLVETAEGRYWEKWLEFMEEAVIANQYVEPASTSLIEVCHSLEDVIDAIESFYANFVSFESDGARGRAVVRRPPRAEQVASLSVSVPEFAQDGGYRLEGERTISFPFDGGNHLSLRKLIDQLNRWAD
jgi:uncharacterized protein (TIGR00730 family)